MFEAAIRVKSTHLKKSYMYLKKQRKRENIEIKEFFT